MTIGKYEFRGAGRPQMLIEACKKMTNRCPHVFAEIGYALLDPSDAGSLSSIYYVDVLWDRTPEEGHPKGWEKWAVYPEDDVLHKFAGISYNNHKFNP